MSRRPFPASRLVSIARRSLAGRVAVCCAGVVLLASEASAQLFENLEAFETRLPLVGRYEPENDGGPKGLAVGDLDGDALPDLAVSTIGGKVEVYFSEGERVFSERLELDTGMSSLRQIIIADLDGDGLADLATGAVWDEKLVLLDNLGGRCFAAPRVIDTGFHSRNLTAGDFNGDGIVDLAVAGSGAGVREYRGNGDGTFEAAGDLDALDAAGDSRPVYSLRAFRAAGETRDSLVVSHAWAESAWTLAQGESGRLEIAGRVDEVEQTFSLDVGAVKAPAAGGALDLVTAERDLGVVEVRPSSPSPSRFQTAATQRIQVPGGPRALDLVDLDGDGWNDLVVVLRNFDRVLTYRNDNGTFVPAAEMPVGVSPRELGVADFTGDGELDLAVINRRSFDVSVLPGRPGEVGFSVLDQTYLVDGEVTDLEVVDLDDDGRDDIVQLHKTAGDMSVWLSGEGGRLSVPTFYRMGDGPAALSFDDVNDDGVLDALSSNLGANQRGSLGIRLGSGGGAFGPLIEIDHGVGGSLFSVITADFDNDGIDDVAVGFLDCRLGFLKGLGDGTFEQTRVHRFIMEARAMVAEDFDQDGDIDIAGASFTGDIIVVENRGDLLTTERLDGVIYGAPSEGKFGTRDMTSEDLNGDGDPDLVIASGRGVMIYHGAEGMRFELASVEVSGTDFPTSSVATTDFDGDGSPDIVVSCRVFSCIIILTLVGGEYRPALTIDVPSGQFLALGDLDGDGHTDIVGSGSVLWTALSSRRTEAAAPPAFFAERPSRDAVVINEILAINNSVPLASDELKKPDWVELYNGMQGPVSLAGWRLRVTEPSEPGLPAQVDDFVLPPVAIVAPRSHLLLVCSSEQRTPLHTGFRLPGDGATVTLLSPSGDVVDEVTYPAQFENVSYGRFRDGVESFAFNPFPNADEPNVDNGSVPPTMELEFVDAGLGNAPLRFFASGRDDDGIVAASVLMREVGTDDVQRVLVFDDGLHGDGELLDGDFAGMTLRSVPAGTEVELLLEVEDLSGNVVRSPSDGTFDAEEPGSVLPYRIVVGGAAAPSGVEISELVALNETGLQDDDLGFPDWIELRNCGTEPAALDDLVLTKSFPNLDSGYAFPAASLAPGEHIVVFADGNTLQGSDHAPFTLRAGGDRLTLARRTPSGALEALETVVFGQQTVDIAWARQGGCGAEWGFATPTPGESPLAITTRLGDVNLSGDLNIADASALLNYLFRSGPEGCLAAADTNEDGSVNISDAVRILGHLFLGNATIPDRQVDC